MYCTGMILITVAVVAFVIYMNKGAKEEDVKASPAKIVPAPKFSAEEPFKAGDLPIGGGASPDLDKPRNPYTLLDGLQPRLLGEQPVAYINAEGCYARDYNSVHSLTGNYSKLTNNVMPMYPDNCTGPRQEFTAAFYTLNRA
jgi:hypothetical protein